jgi:uncharacterized protein involved in type VI secretion and phage assembly
MSLNTRASIAIEGQLFKQFKYLNIVQPIDGHHEFSVHVYDDWIITSGKDPVSFLGKEISVVISDERKEQLQFKGIVSRLSIGMESDGVKEYCIISGMSPTLLMENNPDIRSYEERQLSSIVEEHLKVCRSYVDKIEINPSTDSLLRYTVQYRESSYQFIRRLAEQRGEWFFYNGRKLVFGKYEPAKWTLKHGVNLHNYAVDLLVSPAKGLHNYYDYRKSKLYTEEWPHAAYAKGLVQEAASMSDRLYDQPSVYKSRERFSILARSELSRLVAVYNQYVASGRVTVRGKSSLPAVRVGDTVRIAERSYLVMKISHSYTGIGTYFNEFEGVAAETATAKVVLDHYPFCEAQRGVVTDHNDPKGLGRVKVRFDWQKNETSPWLRVLTPYAGAGKGFFLVPELNEEVWVEFEGANPELPYVAGALYNGASAPEWSDEENNIKLVKTRSGHTIRLDDSSGKEQITIADKVGNKITFDTWDKSISIKSPESIYLEARQLFINTQENIAICAGESFTCYTGKDLELQATAKLQLRAEDLSKQVSDTYSLHAKEIEQVGGKIKIESTKDDLELISAAQIDIQSQEKIRLF